MQSEAVWVVGRNGLLVLILTLGMPLRGGGDRDGRQRSTLHAVRVGSPSRDGVSLMETLVVVVLTAVLASIVLPVLARARFAAQDAVSNSNLRTHAQVCLAYAGDWQDHLPYVTRPDATTSIIRGCGGWGYSSYFGATVVWPIPLADGYYDGACAGAVFHHPACRGDGFNSYMLSASTLAEPAYWDLTTRTGPNQWAPQRLPKVQFPAAKAILVEIHPVYNVPYQSSTRPGNLAPVGLAAVDGSVGRWRPDDLLPGVTSGEGIYDGIYLGQGVFGMHTINGVLGRDIIR
jgi:type II secretory pathway pseudopilin PulG